MASPMTVRFCLSRVNVKILRYAQDDGEKPSKILRGLSEWGRSDSGALSSVIRLTE